MSFEISSETAHITQSLETVGRYVETGDPADFHGAIGVEGKEVKGCDIPAHNFQFGWTVYVPKELVTVNFVATLADMVGCMNDAAFLSFPRGEILFIGASGSRRQRDTDWEITYKFLRSKNIADMQIGPIEGISKLGHDYLWVKYEDAVDDDAHILLPKPVQVNVERVVRFADFSPLAISLD
ncbi:MAG: hypothetical protein QM775_16640 [Pirellulales bacterium]